MANPFFGAPQGGGARREFLSDIAAAERDVEAYFTGLASQPSIGPEGVAPFGVNNEQALEAYTKWLNGLSMAPGDLKTRADLGALKAVFIPFWVVSSMGYTTYKGQRGLNFQDTETYKDAQGNSQTRQVTRTRWSPAVGELTHYFENLLICGKADLPADHEAHLTPRDVSGLQHYVAAEHKAAIEAPTIDPRAAFGKARSNMETEIKKLCSQNIGGDQQTVDSTQTRYVNVSVRHVVLPCYQGTYKYKDKDYNILVNAVTGKVIGARPYSAGKIATLVGAIVLALVIIGVVIWLLVAPPWKHAELPEKEQPASVHVALVDGGPSV
jgi:hypothetical protein